MNRISYSNAELGREEKLFATYVQQFAPRKVSFNWLFVCAAGGAAIGIYLAWIGARL